MNPSFPFEGPSAVLVRTDEGWQALASSQQGRWSARGGLQVSLTQGSRVCSLELEAPESAVHLVKLRWNVTQQGHPLILGDQWERGYGDLAWRGIVPERIMPWYFLIYDGTRTAGYGVLTGPNAFCSWQLDADGITFTAEVACGSEGVRLGSRTLHVANLLYDSGHEGESAFASAQRFCRLMCNNPVLPEQPVYGGNNWYYAYGNSSHNEILEDSRFMSSLSSHKSNRPYMVIDDGWQLASGDGACNGGPWIGNDRFPDMERLIGEMKAIGVKPGLWCRPLLTAENVPDAWVRFAVEGGRVLDPSRSDVLQHIRESVQKMASWGIELLKHDFSAYDLLGQWGFTMRSKPNGLKQSFQDRSRTTAEITLDLYRTLAEAAGKAAIIGCNTFSHLSAGLFHIQRTGDDTSGKWWERTRYMGVNTMAFRMPQHGTFYSHDADCLGLTDDVPWSMNKQWLQLLAGSGTPVFVSADPAKVTKEQELAIRRAFELAAEAMPTAEPLDWLHNTCPSRWFIGGQERTFAWNDVTAELLEEKDNGWWL